jgi:DNA end-binding protein Ku
MRAIWTGYISFGLVTIPVHLYSATEEHGTGFHQVRDCKKNGPVSHSVVTESCEGR